MLVWKLLRCIPLLFALRLYTIFAQVPFHEYFAEEHRQAWHQLQQTEKLALTYFKPAELAYVWAMVYPEMVRYQRWRDQLEMWGLRLLYSQYGASYANFSVGWFQMKPTFVEQLEHLGLTYGCWQSALPDTSDTPEARRARLSRMESLEGQLQYLKIFWCVVHHCYIGLRDLPAKEKVRFIAAIYNYGLCADEAALRDWMLVKAFPYGQYHPVRYAYADIAAWFYEQWITSKKQQTDNAY